MGETVFVTEKFCVFLTAVVCGSIFLSACVIYISRANVFQGAVWMMESSKACHFAAFTLKRVKVSYNVRDPSEKQGVFLYAVLNWESVLCTHYL